MAQVQKYGKTHARYARGVASVALDDTTLTRSWKEFLHWRRLSFEWRKSRHLLTQYGQPVAVRCPALHRVIADVGYHRSRVFEELYRAVRWHNV